MLGIFTGGFTVIISSDTGEEPSLRRSISPRVELSCLTCYYTVGKECAECWGGSSIARVFDDVNLQQVKLLRDSLMWCLPPPLLCSPAVLVLMSHVCSWGVSLCQSPLSVNTWVEALEWEYFWWDALTCLKSARSSGAQLVGT